MLFFPYQFHKHLKSFDRFFHTTGWEGSLWYSLSGGSLAVFIITVNIGQFQFLVFTLDKLFLPQSLFGSISNTPPMEINLRTNKCFEEKGADCKYHKNIHFASQLSVVILTLLLTSYVIWVPSAQIFHL